MNYGDHKCARVFVNACARASVSVCVCMCVCARARLSVLWADSPTVTTASFSYCTGTDLCSSFLIYEHQSTPLRTPPGRCDRVNEVWRRHGKPRVPEMTDDSGRIIASFCRQRGKLKTGLVFGVPPPLLSPRRIWFKGENQDGRRLRAGRKSWQLLRKVRKLAPQVHL